MEKTLHNILGEIRRTNAPLAPDALDRIIRARNREVAGPVRYVAKKKLLPFYQEVKEHRPEPGAFRPPRKPCWCERCRSNRGAPHPA